MQAWRDHGPTIVVSFLLLPVFGVAGLLALRGRRWAAEIAVIAGTVPWLVMAFTPQPAPGALVLVPLIDLAELATDPGDLLAQVGGNLLFLAAFGAFAPVRWRVFAHPGRLFAAAVAASVTIEVAQYAVDVGRVSSVDDVLVNSTGALLACLATRRWWAWHIGSPTFGDRLYGDRSESAGTGSTST